MKSRNSLKKELLEEHTILYSIFHDENFVLRLIIKDDGEFSMKAAEQNSRDSGFGKQKKNQPPYYW